MAELVQVESLQHRYGERVALAGVSFEVRAGECFGLLGPNGGGKTTLFRILTTLLRPAAGRARIDGFDVVAEREAVRARIGVVFQSPSLDPWLTVCENLHHHGRLFGLAGTALVSGMDDALARMGIADRARDLARKLSGGLRRRVEIAACLLHRPVLMILDEPSTGLDPAARRELWEHLSELRKKSGLTVLLTTHYLEEAERCDRLGILDRGRLVACGSPQELKSRIGGDCVTIDGEDISTLGEELGRRFGCLPVRVGESLRFEWGGGPGIVGDLMAAYGGRIHSLTIGKPSLEDVFVHETGRRFDD